MLNKIVSGGQTGVDRAALDVALALKIPCGGWCPRGRRAADGTISPAYPLLETPSSDYAERTEWNVRDSDGTLVLTRGEPSQGTAFTIDVARRLEKPCLVVDMSREPDEQIVLDWIVAYQIQILNIAGPREEKCPGIYQHAREFFHAVLSTR